MKIAKLPIGKTLKFPDDTSEEEIDAAVREHMKDHIDNVKKQEGREKQFREESLQRHDELMLGLNRIAELLHHLIGQNIKGYSGLSESLDKHTNILNDHTKLLNKKRRMKAIRDEKSNKIVGSEEW